MTERELQRWLRNSGLADAWWVSIDGEVIEEPRRLAEIIRMKRSSAGRLQVLHVSQAENKEPPWVTLTSSDKNKSKRSKKKKSKHWLWLAAACVIVAAVLVAVVASSSDGGKNTQRSTAETVPPLRVRVGRSEWILYIFNGNMGNWPSVEVTLREGEQSWKYEWNNPLAPEGTLQIPFRDFVDQQGNRLSIQNGIPQRIEITVPGYLDFDERMR